MKLIEYMLRDKIGLDAASIGSSLIQRTVRLRMKALGLKTPEHYQRLLSSSKGEWDELIEAVVVTETWFFRDREPFSVLIRLLLNEWLPAHPGKAVSVLSIPCSSGEEPYSLVMGLLDAGVPPERFQVDAIDISARVLARARRGLYGRNSFRGQGLEFRDRYFQPVKEGFFISPAVRDLVRFSQGNLLDDGFADAKGAYDFIFCRNLLIYFDRPTQQKALNKIANLLISNGVLFVGPAELPLVIEQGFVSANISMAFACRKALRDSVPDNQVLARPGRHQGGRSSLPNGALPGPATRKVDLPSADAGKGAATYALPQVSPVPLAKTTVLHRPGPVKSPPSFLAGIDDNSQAERPAPPVPPVPSREQRSSSTVQTTRVAALAPPMVEPQPETLRPDLVRARNLADAGRLAEAAAICEKHLGQCPGSAQAYYLLGLISDANGSSSAVDYYRKALYLDPRHDETLLQLALLAEKGGDLLQARTYKRRFERLRQKVKRQVQ
jgi:chemotaxis protein methyltransferase WspC